MSGTDRCPKCGTTKRSSKRSCCARGGAWFKNCGDAGDTEFDHTWTEGIQVCKDFTAATLRTQVVLRYEGGVANPMITVQARNTAQQQTDIYHFGIMPNVCSTDFEDSGRFANVFAYVCVLYVTFNVHA